MKTRSVLFGALLSIQGLALGCKSTVSKPATNGVAPNKPTAPDLQDNRHRMVTLAMTAMDINVYSQGGTDATHHGQATLDVAPLLKQWSTSTKLHSQIRRFVSEQGQGVFDESLPKAASLPAAAEAADLKSNGGPGSNGPPAWLARPGGFHALADGRNQIVGRAIVSKIRNEGLARQTLNGRLRRDFKPRIERYVDAILKAFTAQP